MAKATVGHLVVGDFDYELSPKRLPDKGDSGSPAFTIITRLHEAEQWQSGWQTRFLTNEIAAASKREVPCSSHSIYRNGGYRGLFPARR
jgi:hypothetical protein